MYQTALLLLSGPLRIVIESIGQYLSWTNKKVAQRLYVKLEPELCKPFSKSDTVSLKRLSSVVPILYYKASSICKNIDVRVLLGNTEQSKIIQRKPINFDAVLTNCGDHNDIKRYVELNFGNQCSNIIKLNDLNIPSGHEESESGVPEFNVYKTVCLGGTFDRLHNGHKVFLSEAVLKASEELVVGVSDGDGLKRKILWELIEPIEKRMKEVTNFLWEIDPSLQYEVVPITDIYGPTVTRSDIDCLVVTTETKLGGEKVNIERKRRGMTEVLIKIIDVVENTGHSQDEEEKISSSTKRMQLLGTPLKTVKPSLKADKPYCVLLQGHFLSGKSFIANRFQVSGIPVLSCDEILYAILNKDLNLKESCIKEISSEICCDDGSLNLQKLIVICLKNKVKKDWLAQLLLNKVKSTLEQIFQVYSREGARAVLVTDSSLFEGCDLGIQVDEIWATILPTSDSLVQFKEVYKFTEEEATQFMDCLSPNKQYVDTANIIFCNKWSPDTTQEQVNRAYSYLKSVQE